MELDRHCVCPLPLLKLAKLEHANTSIVGTHNKRVPTVGAEINPNPLLVKGRHTIS